MSFIGNYLPLTGGTLTGTLTLPSLGLPAWTTYTPTVTPAAGAITAYATNCAYLQIGKFVSIRGTITITTNGTGSGFLTVDLPNSTTGKTSAGIAGNNYTSHKALSIAVDGGLATMRIWDYSAAYPAASGDVLAFSGVYEAT